MVRIFIYCYHFSVAQTKTLTDLYKYNKYFSNNKIKI